VEVLIGLPRRHLVGADGVHTTASSTSETVRQTFSNAFYHRSLVNIGGSTERLPDVSLVLLAGV